MKNTPVAWRWKYKNCLHDNKWHYVDGVASVLPSEDTIVEPLYIDSDDATTKEGE